ncbi:TIGR02680 family protein [Tumebacillus avium]|uniref:TIGR02680 family protein n=1 Tax=Tumebacillus avium TaxID=1903704 RepID=A0A1Y0INV8_9BACL|nr:TIGR02680 family protein [Tumebacillus avium]ARU61516.1 TIGR02680 family protein [Tumebacillus avium]
MKNRWKLHRAGFFNFWYFDEEELYFSDGKMLLRGHNGSGKSVTMQSLLPFLLDGNKSPKRLDPFNSSDRRMHDYLCGERETNEVEDRIGYLFLEYKKEKTGQYLTTGVGLQAKAGSKDVDFWGFVVTNNQRVNRGDLCLYHQPAAGNSKLPLTKKELVKLFKEKECGSIVSGQKEYMELVNKHLFGFENLDTFQHLITLLVLLRSPKLSKDFKVTDMHDILTKSLPELTNEELMPFTDSIENLDQLDERIKQYEASKSSVQALETIYRKYNRFLLSQKARAYLEAESLYATATGNHHKLEKQIADTDDKLSLITAELQQLQVERSSLEDQQRILRKNKVFDLAKEHQGLLRKAEESAAKIRETEAEQVKKQQAEQKHRLALQTQDEQLYETEKEIRTLEGELTQSAHESEYAEHRLELDKFRRQLSEGKFSFDYWKQSAQQYRDRLREIVTKSQAEQTAKGLYQSKTDEIARDEEDLRLSMAARDSDWTAFELHQENFLDAFHLWATENKELHLGVEERDRIHQLVLSLYDKAEFEEIRLIVEAVYERRSNTLNERIADVRNEQKELQHKLKTLQQDLKAWTLQKDPEPARHPETQQARETLAREGIPFLPFYAAVDFREEVPAEVRNRLEHALRETGLLDALLVSAMHANRAQISDKVLTPGSQQSGATLAAYLTPLPGLALPTEEIMSILQSVSMEDTASEFRITHDGQYKMGVLEGIAPDFGDSVFIGHEARERFRQQKIAELQEQIRLLEHELYNYQQAEESFVAALHLSKAEKSNFPKEREMKAAYSKWNLASGIVTKLQESLRHKETVAQTLRSKWQSILRELLAMTEELTLENSPEAYEFAHESQQLYIGYLNDVERMYQSLLSGRANRQTVLTILEEVTEDLDRVKHTLSGYQTERDSHLHAAEALRILLDEKGLESLQQEVANIERRLHGLPAEIEKKSKLQGRTEADLNRLEMHFESSSNQLRFYDKYASAWQELFQKEAALGFIQSEAADALLRQGDIKGMAETIAGQLELSDVSLDQLKSELFEAFHVHKDYLLGYYMERNEIVLTAPGDIDAFEDAGLTAKRKELHEATKRFLITLEHGDHRVSPKQMEEHFDDRIERTKRELSEKERELFRKILMNNIGEVIRNKIAKVVDWVEQMRELMKQRKGDDSSNGFKVFLNWKPKADMKTDGGVSIIELLRKDPKVLQEADLDHIAAHFSAKINKAKLMLTDERKDKVFRTLHHIVKETLDYRQWFEFVLDCQKGEETLHELTQKKFNKLSGGEKAMAMYIPLFTAVYSRYLDANSDAPHIITLDEAFAGVDHSNINKMFALVEELGFDYVMNSQMLWGDYESVSTLSIYELIHPPGAKVVAMERYIWDGEKLMERQANDIA